MPDVLEVQMVPSDEVRIVPDGPTVTNVLPPYVTPLNELEILLPLSA